MKHYAFSWVPRCFSWVPRCTTLSPNCLTGDLREIQYNDMASSGSKKCYRLQLIDVKGKQNEETD